ncbi:hypothetical protein AC241_31495 (plasmid) [Bacillus thuringiensis]|uniref:hypothetical protein n=1 Tax=Bacillus thuringiensis TaxID=1428 RepID=UPI000676BB49|nr:hypothetical protein [Bacillus thuringiensis]AKR13179.1 hypothetical protein AC241_31495 [Bacillus thuringiensis]
MADEIIQRKDITATVGDFSSGLTDYLVHLDLPCESILVDPDERTVVINNLPNIVTRLNDQQKTEAMYISKFIAACGAGLFDAAINFLWNETVVNLRNKVIRFDMDYFLSTVVTDPKRRKNFKTEEDLVKLDDWELVKGCKDTGIITQIGFKHLDYIRDMRNHASAAHPNHNDLDGLQISSYLQTCIKEVLAKEPEGPVLEIKRLLHNIRTEVLNETDIPPILSNITKLPVDLVDSLVRAIFGMYLDSEIEVTVRNNIKLLVHCIWDNSSKQAKQDIGLKYAVFSVNADLERKKLSHEFLSLVDGLSYLSEDQIAVEIDSLLDSLHTAHYGWDNFYNEPKHIRMISKYVPQSGDIPISVLDKYVKTIITCRLGNSYGVSRDAVGHYDELIQKFQEEHFKVFVGLLQDTDIISKLEITSCANLYKKLDEDFSMKPIQNKELKKFLERLSSATVKLLPKIHRDERFPKIINAINQ